MDLDTPLWGALRSSEKSFPPTHHPPASASLLFPFPYHSPSPLPLSPHRYFLLPITPVNRQQFRMLTILHLYHQHTRLWPLFSQEHQPETVILLPLPWYFSGIA